MNWVWKVKVLGASGVVACATLAGGQTPEPVVPADNKPMLTLSSPMLRSTMEKLNLSWVFPGKMPDFRLKMERPVWGPLSPLEMQGRLRGLEIQLPVQGLWVGYETTADGTEPRATFSIQRGF